MNVPPSGSLGIALDPLGEFAGLHRICARNGFQEAIDGHMSYKVSGDEENVFLSPYPLHWSRVTISSLARVNLSDGVVVSDGYKLDRPTWFVHRWLQRSHPRHRCFIHVHAPFSTALSCRCDGRFLPIHQHMISLYNEIAYLDAYLGQVLDEDYSLLIARAIGSRSILVLANHGVIVGGLTPAHAFKRLYFLERAAQFQIYAEAGGSAVKLIDDVLLRPTPTEPDKAGTGHADYLFQNLLVDVARDEPDFLS